MNRWRLVLRSAQQFWQTNLAVLLGVAAATAVLTGALIIGDSVRGSLRDLALSRLGSIQEILLADRFFRPNVAEQISQHNANTTTVPIVLMQGTLQTVASKPDEPTKVAGNLAVLGIDEAFWKLGDVPGWTPTQISDDEIILNQPLADELGVKQGDLVTLRLPGGNDVPADSPLGRKTAETQSLPRLTVKAVIPAEGLGRFGMHPTQQLPLNAYASKAALQDALEQDDRVNAVLVSHPDGQTLDLSKLFLTLADYNFELTKVEQTFQQKTIYDYWQLTSSRMIFGNAAADAVERAFEGDAHPTFTYLATSIGVGEVPDGEDKSSIPYSTVTALQFSGLDYPLVDQDGKPIEKIGKNEIVLNSWTAEHLASAQAKKLQKANPDLSDEEAKQQSKLKPGDTIYLQYFAPESSHGVAQEIGRTFRLAAITPLTEPDQPFRRSRPPVFDKAPTTANDPDYTPVVKGITDQDSIDDWDPPFPYDNSRVDGDDEEYWDNYRTTPKAFVALETGQELWGSRFGEVTAFRFFGEQYTDEHALQTKIEDALASHRSELGFRLLTVRQDALRAAAGTTPFNVLFMGFSMFIIGSAIMLVSLLFRLGLEQRSQQIGLLQAVGLNRKVTQGLLMREAGLIALVGSIAGVIIGIGYAWLMLVGLRTWWLGAVVTPFLTLHLDNPSSLLIGLVSGSLVCLLTIFFGMRGLKKLSVRGLLQGSTTDTQITFGKPIRWAMFAGIACALGAVGLSFLAAGLGGEAQAGAFFGSGALVLTACLLLLWHMLRSGAGSGRESSFSLGQLALSNAARNPGRSTLTIGLIASAAFLIVAIGAFRLSPTDTGSGGMNLIAESSQPLYRDLNTPEGRLETGFSDEEDQQLKSTTILSLRVQPGDDASCLNLYQSNSPRVLGVTPSMMQYYAQSDVTHFDWVASAATSGESKWEVLAEKADGITEPIPVVLDNNTAMYALHLYGGIGEEFTTTEDDGRETRYVVAGLLSNCVFQGNLLISEANFLASYPDVSGYEMFLIRTPEGKEEEVRDILENRLADQGFDITSAEKILTSLLAVQNTYLSTFQSLGALGLLLGTFGLAAVQLRTILERRSELALLRAAGFSDGRLYSLVMRETMVLLLGGLATGVISALVTVVPHMVFGNASIPFASLGGMLGVILVVGIVSSSLAVRSALKGNIVPALRGS
ncbi:FtsX-like permease family protein [Bremerella volcania]|uniref:FtsX-like permease family protein n=1 Tax=Bremerella volcania TaxID=2527984 RepID=A0A518C3P8_9BACT|nr:FtsX-like permease family protein [Bremerella volcania]QDU73852.1 FtsX-like permease family protein [Bremerella volcania]